MSNPFTVISSINKNLNDIYSGYKQSLLFQKTLLTTKEINVELLETLIYSQIQMEKKFDRIKENIEDFRKRLIKDTHNKITHELQIRIIDNLTEKYCQAQKRVSELENLSEDMRTKLKRFYLNSHVNTSCVKCIKAERSRHISKSKNKSEISKDQEKNEQQNNIHINFNYKPITNVQIFHDNASKNMEESLVVSANISSSEIDKFKENNYSASKNIEISRSTPLLDRAARFNNKSIEVKSSNSTELKRDENEKQEKSASNLKNYSKYRKNKHLEAGAVIFPESKSLAETKFIYDLSGQSSITQNRSKAHIQNSLTPSKHSKNFKKPSNIFNSCSEKNLQIKNQATNRSSSTIYGKAIGLQKENHLIKVKKKVNPKLNKIRQATEIEVPDDPIIKSQITLLSKGVNWLGLNKLK